MLSDLRSHCWGLNAGSSSTRIHSQMINLDLCASPDVDIVGTIEDIPFGDASLHCAVSQEVLEHVADPHAAVREIYRVLVPAPASLCKHRLFSGFTAHPHDYWRFTNYGLQQLLTGAGFQMEEVGVSVGAGAAIHQIAVEFAAASAAALWQKLYLPVKATAALAMSPLRLADYFTSQISPCNRIPSGFYAIAGSLSCSEHRHAFQPGAATTQMNILICSESHYVQVGGELYCPLLSPDYFQRYREAWDEVIVLARASVASQPPQGAPRLALEGVRLVALPDYTGPLQYLACRRRIRTIVREVLPSVDSIIMRGGHQISQVVYSFLAEPAGRTASKWWAILTIRWPAVRPPIRCGAFCGGDLCEFSSGCVATLMPRPT